VGSVFVVRRIGDRPRRGSALDVAETGERFALKVPEYSATAARRISETEFLKLFREEANTLMTLPQHPNLARFVSFDPECKPKPVLVMELVEGTTLDSLLQARDMSTVRALTVLDDVLRGLEAMHSVGIGHLDVKPANVVLRGGEQGVLVDFGLSGKHIRPGCATGPYGAPEVWGALDGALGLEPAKADMYAYGCLLFEALTGRSLFEAESEMAQIAAHLAHDGFPPALRALAKRPGLSALAELCFALLRRNPADRPTAVATRKELGRVVAPLRRRHWPVDEPDKT
jgi:serine/threonine protein kinase